MSLEAVVNTLTSMKSQELRAHKIREEVPIEEWINSEYYVGNLATSLYPVWKQHIIEMFNNPNKINEVIFDGPIGTGKTTCANAMMLRRIYELLRR